MAVGIDKMAVAELAVLALAARQHGVISSAQLAAAGLSRGWVRHRVARGWLRRVHRGVYLVGPLEAEHSRAMAGTLAGGPNAVASDYPAAVLWEFRPPREGPMHVIAAGRSQPGLIVHHTNLDPRDRTRRHGIPVTSAARTLLDLAASEPTRELERALNEAQLHRRVSSHSLNEQFGRYPRHRGTAALKKAIHHEPRLTRSEAERLMLELVREAGLPEPETNVMVAGHEVDLLWREQRLIVEIDGYAFHSMRRSFERDRQRDQALVAARHRVTRVTWRQLSGERTRIVATLATALAA